MKTLFSGVLIVLATSYVAMAQPAYSPDQGSAPANYPPCTHRGEDRCVQGAGEMAMGHHGHRGPHHHAGRHHAAHRGHKHHKH